MNSIYNIFKKKKKRLLKNFLKFFFENPGRRRKFQPSAKISAAGENLSRRRKSRISTKISDFGENLGFRRKSQISTKISDFGKNLGFATLVQRGVRRTEGCRTEGRTQRYDHIAFRSKFSGSCDGQAVCY